MSSSPDSHSLDSLPDAIVLLILDRVADVKTLACCAASSRRLCFLFRQVHNVVIKVDSVITEDDATSSSSKPRTVGPLSCLLPCRVVKTLGHFLGPKKDKRVDRGSKATLHHSPSQVLKDFTDIKFLRIEMPSPELGLGSDTMLKWRASYGNTLDNCVVLGATSVCKSKAMKVPSSSAETMIFSADNDNGVIPESFYANGELRSRVVWTIGSLITASARHYQVQTIIEEHKTLERLVVSDMAGQGVLRMEREQLNELRATRPSVSCSSRRTVVPDLEMRMWYASRMELMDGSVLVGVTLVAVRPKEKMVLKEKFLDGDWISGAFEEPFASAANVLVKGRTYSVDMSSF